MFVAVELTGVTRDCATLRGTLNQHIGHALQTGLELIANDVRQNHPYTDRTGSLTASIRVDAVNGAWTAGNLTGSVTAAAEYASYVEAAYCQGKNKSVILSPGPYAYLSPGFVRNEMGLLALLEAAMTRAAHDAGWRTESRAVRGSARTVRGLAMAGRRAARGGG